MKEMKKILLLVLAMMMISMNIVSAKTLRAVQLPLIITPNANVSVDTIKQIEVKISRAMFVPATENIQSIEYIPSYQSREALKKVMNNINGVNTGTKLMRAMEPLAEKLDADFIVCTIVHESKQEPEGLGGFGGRIKSDVAVDMILYDRLIDELLIKRSVKNYNNDFNVLAMSDALTIECVMNLIDELKIKNRLLKHLIK